MCKKQKLPAATLERFLSTIAKVLVRRGRIVIDTIDGPVLQGNRLGDPCARQLALYLPHGFDLPLRQ